MSDARDTLTNYVNHKSLQQNQSELTKTISDLLKDYDKLKTDIDEFWKHLHNVFHMESRENIEKEAKENWNPPNPLVVALQYIWIRKTNTEGRLERIESSIKFINNKFVTHDNEVSSDCTRCNVVCLAQWMSEIIQTIKEK